MIPKEKLFAYYQLIRLDKPIGILLLLWPTLWALWLAADGLPDLMILTIFVLGTVLMRSAGCAINDFADRHIDPHVARTRQRPLATGLVQPQEALWVAAGLSLCAFLLILPLNWLTIGLSVCALLLAASYPFTKRFFAMPQAYLGLSFSIGMPMAFAAQTNALPPIVWLLMVANLCWVIAYDTQYAMADREDDLKIGIKTSAITLGRFDVAGIVLCHVTFVSILVFAGGLLQGGILYYAALLVVLGLIIHQYHLIRDREPARCFQAFLHNNWIGATVFIGILLDAMSGIGR
ncbi:4-hydroxybenzoate octaprenyltransferase [Nitrosomonas sp. ANs5]|uniref:4-hydroxybenzoate octaprenyltransferase n=1 Tax=Nitrosomonas sp. ANs5 TaxID=3423941 RepID=UPI003D328D4C